MKKENKIPSKTGSGISANAEAQHSVTIEKTTKQKLPTNISLLGIAGKAAKFGGWSVDLISEIVYWSDEVCDIHEMPRGYTPVISEGFNFFAPEYRDAITKVFTDCAKSGIPFVLEVQIITSNGKRVWVRTFGEPVRDKKGNIIKVQGAFKDISEKKQYELALIESEEKYRALVETSLDTIFINQNNKIVYINPAGINMLGATCEEDVIGKYPLGFFPAETHGNIQQRLEAMLTTGKNAQRAENQVIRLDGKIIDVEVTAAPLIYKGEKAFQVVIKDISERKAAERELKSSEERFRKAFISHPGIISITTLSEGKYLDVNDNFCKMLEYERSEVIGSPSKELGIFYDNNKRDELLNILKRDGRVVNFEVRVKTKSGKIKTGLFSSEMIEMDGQECLLAQFDDITESKRNTAVTESKLHLTRFAISHSLEELLEETLNEAEKLTDSLIGFYHFVDDDQKSLTLQNWSTQTKEKFCKAEGKGTHYPIDMAGVWVDCTKTGKPVIHNNYASLPHRKGLPDGHAEVIRELVVPVSRNDKIKAILGVGNKQFDYNEKDVETVSLLADMVWDITEFKKIDEELKESEARLREMVTTKDKFFNIIAHDLRSPFNAIMGFSELLEEQMKEKNYEDIEEYSKFIHSASRRAMNLLSNLLEWSRSQTGKIKFNPEYFDLAVLINEVTDLFTDIAAQKSIEIKKVMKPNIPVIADKPMVEIILRNLISNAIKFSNFNTSIVISAELKENETLVSVKDNGVGISPEDINNIFRLDINHSTLGTNKEKGTGLGLLLCKEFIEKHNGKLLIESTLGKGSTFCLNIPKNQ